MISSTNVKSFVLFCLLRIIRLRAKDNLFLCTYAVTFKVQYLLLEKLILFLQDIFSTFHEHNSITHFNNGKKMLLYNHIENPVNEPVSFRCFYPVSFFGRENPSRNKIIPSSVPYTISV